MIDVEEFVNGYLDGALFTENVSEDDDTSLLSHGCERDDFSADARHRVEMDCLQFIGANLLELERYCELLGGWRHGSPDSFGRISYSAAERAGTDFWFSRNGHGAGYFDGGNDPVFDELQVAARVWGEQHMYLSGEEIEVM